MRKQQSENLDLEFYPLNRQRWADFEALFGERGACGGCWCMFWRLTRSEFETQKGERNRKAMKTLVDAGKIPGILAYAQKKPVAWCSVAPRRDFSALERSRVLKKIDDQPVWSVTCFFIDRGWRKKGLSVRLLRAAVEYVAEQGGRIVEGYPVEPKKAKTADVFVWTGLASTFLKAGFVECTRRSATRPIMRYSIL